MRPTTALTIFVALIMSVSLYFLKNEVTELEHELDFLNRAIVTDQGAVRVLEAEWSHLNDTRRLRELARRYLELAPTEPGQIIRAAEIKNLGAAADGSAAAVNHIAQGDRRGSARP